MKSNIILNKIENHEIFHVDFPESCEPLKFLKNTLSSYEKNVFLFVLMAGRRIINQNNCNFISGRRIRAYYGIKKNNKIKVNFSWHKIKKLSGSEEAILKETWKENFGFENFQRFVKKSGGCVFFENLI